MGDGGDEVAQVGNATNPGLALDAAVSRLPAWLRGWGAIGTVLVTTFALGFAAGTYGVRERIQTIEADIEMTRQRQRVTEADVATNRSEIAGLRSTVQAADLLAMAERLRRMDRVMCLSVENLPPQECARR